MDITQRKITKIAREAEKLVLLTMREEGVGTAEVEASFYEYLTAALTEDEAAVFAAMLNKLYVVSKTESRAGFPHLRNAAEGEHTDET